MAGSANVFLSILRGVFIHLVAPSQTLASPLSLVTKVESVQIDQVQQESAYLGLRFRLMKRYQLLKNAHHREEWRMGALRQR